MSPSAMVYVAGPLGRPGRVESMIRYCATAAGRVAYSTVGSGPPLLFDSGWVSHLRGQLEMYAFGAFVERLAERFTVIRYDKPGCGLSDRGDVDLSFEGQLTAALAVAGSACSARRRAASSRPRSRPGIPSGSARWWCTGCAPAAGTWPRRRSGSRW